MSKSILAGLLGYIAGLPAAFAAFWVGGFLFHTVFAQLFAWAPALKVIGIYALFTFVAVVFGWVGGWVTRSRGPQKQVALVTFSGLTIPSLGFLMFGNLTDIPAVVMSIVAAIASILSFRVSSGLDS